MAIHEAPRKEPHRPSAIVMRMRPEGPREVTRLLRAYAGGDSSVLDEILSFLYDDLLRVAHHQRRGLRPGETLSTTALVHETYLKLSRQSRLDAKDRSHFLSIASRAMRQVLVDHARKRAAKKRERDEGNFFFPSQSDSTEHAERLLEVDGALNALGDIDPRLVKLVECRFFAGLTETETAEALGVSSRTVQRDWRRASVWLRRLLSTPSALESSPPAAPEPARSAAGGA